MPRESATPAASTGSLKKSDIQPAAIAVNQGVCHASIYRGLQGLRSARADVIVVSARS
jgi:hypothetical protein